MIIYRALNIINGKSYIGQTQDDRLEKRIEEHLLYAKQSPKNAFHRAINKYGAANFEFTVIEWDIPVEQIDAREIFWIDYYNTYIHAINSNGYNETLGGQGTRGYKFTESDIKKISIASKATWAKWKEETPELYLQKIKHLKENMNTVWTPERRKKLSDSCKGRIPWNKNKKGVQKGWSSGLSNYPAVCQFSLETGQLIKVFNTEQQAAKSILQEGHKAKLSTIIGRIHLINLNGCGHAYGYIWRFITNYSNVQQLSAAELAQELAPARAKIIQQFDLAENCIRECESAAAYSKILAPADKKLQRKYARTINDACNSGKQAFGYFWKYKNT